MMRYYWFLVGLFLLSGCSTYPYIKQTKVQGTDKFNIHAVYRECSRIGCQEPNNVVARHFANILQKTGSACIVHIAPEHGQPPWSYWRDYLHPMQNLLVDSQLDLYAYVPPGRNQTKIKSKAQQNLKKIEHLYIDHGAASRHISTKITGNGAAIIPPYRDGYCQNRPVLEIVDGARLVSPVASRAAEHVELTDRASRTVLVVIKTKYGK